MPESEVRSDFALDRTQERLEEYLTTVFAASEVTVDQQEGAWRITSQSDTPTGIGPLDSALARADDGRIRLVPAAEIAESGETDVELGPDEYVRAPDGELVEAILEEDADSSPVGRWRVGDGISDIPDPDWLAESPIEVTNRSFRPYYDRTAVCIVFEASVETVSEFEQTIVVPIAVDAETGERLPKLAAWFDSVTAEPQPGDGRVEVVEESVSADALDGVRSAAQSHAESVLSPKLESIRDRSLRAANVELEEYAGLQDDRIEELRAERERVAEKLEAVGRELEDAADRAERLAAMEERSELREEREEIESELEALESKRERDYPEKRREVRERHAVEVALEAVTVTVVEYEKGDLVVGLAEGGRSRSVTLPYGRGVGVTDAVTCNRCGCSLDAQTSARIGEAGVVCRSCRSERSGR
ncbi:hypothetical protein [Halorussus ruber]|uniref:hypothetical protein n=1 Tax=Halorussus ruber TaxID=1126238 RepID=UPI00109287C9|nr:hypothetical protein [Halorussus ruber]